MIWHTENERKVIEKHGGTALVKSGYDGVIRGRPVEVRECKKDDRFRIQKDVHKLLVRRRGAYIFVNRGRSVRVPAKEVSRMVGNGPWFHDRSYPHKFVKKDQVFKR